MTIPFNYCITCPVVCLSLQHQVSVMAFELTGLKKQLLCVTSHGEKIAQIVFLSLTFLCSISFTLLVKNGKNTVTTAFYLSMKHYFTLYMGKFSPQTKEYKYYRLAMAIICRTFYHGGNISPAQGGGWTPFLIHSI
jgi:hypothetical protein